MNWRERIVAGSSPRFSNHPGVRFEDAVAYAKAQLLDFDQVQFGGTGCATVSRLEFDSEHLGMPCGRIAALGAQNDLDALTTVQRAIELAQALGIDHLSARCDARDELLLDALKGCGFDQVDSIITFTRTLDAGYQCDPDSGVRLATKRDAEAVGEIARRAFTVDRFHSDPLVSKQSADDLHYTWGKNSIVGVAADAVVVAVNESDEPIGFVTCKLNHGTKEALGKLIGTVVLVATSEAARGKGFGRRMTAQALDWFAKQGCEIVEVGTQLSNRPAAALYVNSGFSETDRSVSLRKWLGTASSLIETDQESAKILL